jgi:hypothetical protein
MNGGGRGIRTPVPRKESGFQDRRLKPLGHPSMITYYHSIGPSVNLKEIRSGCNTAALGCKKVCRLGGVKRNPTKGLNPEKLNIEHRTSNAQPPMKNKPPSNIRCSMFIGFSNLGSRPGPEGLLQNGSSGGSLLPDPHADNTDFIKDIQGDGHEHHVEGIRGGCQNSGNDRDD